MYSNFEEQRNAQVAARDAAARKFRRLIIGGVASVFILIFALILWANITTKIMPGYEGIVYSLNGGVKESTLKQGLKFHLPWEDVTQYPVSKETKYLTKGKTQGSPGDDSFDVNTADGKSVNVDMTYAYSFEPSKLGHIFTRFRRADAETIANTYIKQQLKSSIQAITTQYSVVEVYGGEKRNEITKKIQKVFSERLQKDGIIVEDFTFQDIRPDAKTLEAIQKIVDAKNYEEFLRQDYKNKEQEAKNKQLEAETAKKVATIEAQKASEVAKIEAQGQAAATILKANAEAEANKKLSASITPALVEYNKANKWDGKYPSTMLGGNTSMILGK